jgi:hypothetical protein
LPPYPWYPPPLPPPGDVDPLDGSANGRAADFNRALIAEPLNFRPMSLVSVETASASEAIVTNHVSPTSLRALSTVPPTSVKIALTSSSFVSAGTSRRMMVLRSDLMFGLMCVLGSFRMQTVESATASAIRATSVDRALTCGGVRGVGCNGERISVNKKL